MEDKQTQKERCKKILLVGNPNVGKSVIFSRLTGMQAISSNYPGTTISFSEGKLSTGSEVYHVIDVPGSYSLEPTCEAENVARRVIEEGADVIVLVADSTALERNLYLVLQVLSLGYPSILVLNMWDEAKHKGIYIDVEALEEILGVPVIKTVALTGEGIDKLVSVIKEARIPKIKVDISNTEEIWKKVGEITSKVQRLEHRHHTLKDRLEDLSVRPITGLPLGVIVIALSYWVVRFIGEGIINYVADPIFERFYLPFLEKISAFLSGSSFLHDLIVGQLINGKIDFEQSFGLLTTGLYVPLAMVLPYIIAFYFVLGFLEDSGYLPRMAVMFDAIMHKVGLHGYAIIPTLLGLGCNVPGILATRILESDKDRFIAATLISMSVPCTAMQAMVIGLLGEYGGKYVLLVYAVLLLSWFIIGMILNKVISGYSMELIVEIPPYRLPSLMPLFIKLWYRVKSFLLEAVPVVLIGILIVDLLYIIKFFDFLSFLFGPVMQRILGLPTEASIPLIMSFLRKDIAVGMLAPLGLNPRQLTVAVTVMAMFFPCVATFFVFIKEFGFKKLLYALLIMSISAFIAGGILNSIMLYLWG